MLRVFANTSSGVWAWAVPGYFEGIPGGQASLYLAMAQQTDPIRLSNDDFTKAQSFWRTMTDPKVLAAVNAVPAQVPVTVQGASEQFITNTMGQVVANTNQNAVQLNGSIFAARDQVKTHVTNEANRIIAAG